MEPVRPARTSASAASMAAQTELDLGAVASSTTACPRHSLASGRPTWRALSTSAGQEREQGYLYPHSFPGHWVVQQYLPDELEGTVYYEFGDNKNEQAARAYWERLKGEQE